MFGAWFKADSTELRKEFQTAEPFPSLVLDSFFDSDLLDKLLMEFPSPTHPIWMKYHNPIEKKYALNNFTDLPVTQTIFKLLQSPELLDKLRAVTGIINLEIDPHLHGAGLHYHSPGGKLDMHLDYSIHPLSGKERRINLIVYLNDSDDGAIQLWDKDFTKCVKSVLPKFNRAIIFQTSDLSYHGLPTPLRGERKSLAIYYVAEPRKDALIRYKAEFYPLPGQPLNEGLKMLYQIRKTRRIEKEDLDKYFPDWETNSIGKDYWY